MFAVLVLYAERWSILCLCTKLCAAGYMATKSNRVCQGAELQAHSVFDREL